MNPKAILALCVTLCAGQTVQAQLEYSVNADNTLTITGDAAPFGPVGSLPVPTSINGLTVTSIGNNAFEFSDSLASVIIPGSVTNIGDYAFASCTGLTNVTISNGLIGIGQDAFYYCTSLTSVTIPGTVTDIKEMAFFFCTSLTSVTLPASVTNIEDGAFSICTSLTSVYFRGNAPTADSTVFDGDNSNPAIYYLPGTTGWSSPFASRQALLWNPAIQAGGTNFGIQSNQFGFEITGTPYIPIVVEACTNLANPLWTPLNSVTLTNGSFYFSEPVQTNASGRFYRITSP